MSRLFISHSSADDAAAVALCNWLAEVGWDDVFFDRDRKRGIHPGEQWQQALKEAASRCEVVIFLISRAWLASEWCREEFDLARHLNKTLLGAIVDKEIEPADLPARLSGTWQAVNLATGRDHCSFHVTIPITGERADVAFSQEGLDRLRGGLEKAGLEPRFFQWPPADDPNRPPYRGLKPLEADDAGIFFGRDAPIVEALDGLRGLREAAPPRLLVILGASGAGKSSFLRAGLLPRLRRDDRHFLPLPVIRPERAALTGDSGLVHALEVAFAERGLGRARADLRAAVAAGSAGVRPLLQELTDAVFARIVAGEERAAVAPTIVVAIDQAEELFQTEARAEGETLLALLRELASEDRPPLIVILAIRSDSYEQLQAAEALKGLRQQPFSLQPMPRGAYQTVIEGPAARLEDTARKFAIEPALTQRLLEDIERGGGSDALPLLAFTLEQLYRDYAGNGRLTADDYERFGGLAGAIEAAVEAALKAADADPRIPREREARLALLRRGLIPWLCGIDPDTGAPRRRVARLSEIPDAARPLIQYFVEQRLLATDVNKDTGEATIEPAHEALLRQWGLLADWLAEDAGLLAVLEGVKRASRDWAANDRGRAWLAHSGERLAAAEWLGASPDLAANLEPADHDYIAACRKAEADAKRGRRLLQGAIYALLIGMIVGLIGWINQAAIKTQFNWYLTMRPYMLSQVRPYVLEAKVERALKPLRTFHECAKNCPEMVVIPAGTFIMGSPKNENGHQPDEYPPHQVTIAEPFAISKYLVTFDDWMACVSVGGCPAVSDSGFGRGRMPVINVAWKDANLYAAWLSRMTGRHYRLPTEAEWEYAARGGTSTRYSFGDDDRKLDQYAWYNANSDHRPHPVGLKKPNAFGLYDVQGDVWEWVQDCYAKNYFGAPTDGSASSAPCTENRRVARGGSWQNSPMNLRSARRGWYAVDRRTQVLGFRLARTLKR